MEKFKACKVCGGGIKAINELHELVECIDCKLIFSENIFSQEEFVAVYDKLYNKDENSHYKKHSRHEFDLLRKGKVKIGSNRGKLVDKFIIKAKNVNSVLEIGSGVGLLGCYVNQKSSNIFYKGVELDKDAYLKSKELGLDTYNGDFKIINDFDELFDVIMLWEVIEHLQDLSLFLDLAHSKLKEGGKIILSTPNYNKIYNYPNRDKDKLFQDEPPIHLNFFTKNNMKNVFEKKKFKNIDIREKKMPYIENNKLRYLKNCFKALLGRYNGSTLYLIAEK